MNHRVSYYQTKSISEHSLYCVTFRKCHSASFSSHCINYNKENKLFKEENQLKYKRGVIKAHAR